MTRLWQGLGKRALCIAGLAIALHGCASAPPVVSPPATTPTTAPAPEKPATAAPAAAAPAASAAPASGPTPATPSTAPPKPAARSAPAKSRATFGDAQFGFAEIPEIVFVRGYPGRERLGIFHIDTGNRWTPGDLENESGWKPRVATELGFARGRLTGVRYDSTTADLVYDGSGEGNETATVELTAPSLGVASSQFRIRVLEPTAAWGAGAAARFPGIGVDSTQVPWKEMQRSIRKGATDAHPNVLFVTGGRYRDDFFFARGKGNLYVLGDPKSRPVLAGGRINIDDVDVGYLKNFELVDTVIIGSKYPTDTPVNVYITQIYQHDSTRDQNGISAPDYEGDSKYGIVKAPNTQTHWIWNFHGVQMGSPSNLRHQVYMHGRPAGYMNVNNIRVDGARGCSILKSTKYYNIVRNSRLSALQDPAKPALGRRADKLIDFASAGETIIYNNELIGAFTPSA
jgi:hypothetical protein